MKERLLKKVCVGVVLLIFVLVLAKRRRAGKASKTDLVGLAGPASWLLILVPMVFDLSFIWELPFFLAAFALLAFAYRHLPPPGGSGRPK
jgi:hypothetical protein